jgi:hypothetical protein
MAAYSPVARGGRTIVHVATSPADAGRVRDIAAGQVRRGLRVRLLAPSVGGESRPAWVPNSGGWEEATFSLSGEVGSAVMEAVSNIFGNERVDPSRIVLHLYPDGENASLAMRATAGLDLVRRVFVEGVVAAASGGCEAIVLPPSDAREESRRAEEKAYLSLLYGEGLAYSLALMRNPEEDPVDGIGIYLGEPLDPTVPSRKGHTFNAMAQHMLEIASRFEVMSSGRDEDASIDYYENLGSILWGFATMEARGMIQDDGCYFLEPSAGAAERLSIGVLVESGDKELVAPGETPLGAMTAMSGDAFRRQLPDGGKGWFLVLGSDNRLVGKGPMMSGVDKFLWETDAGVVMLVQPIEAKGPGITYEYLRDVQRVDQLGTLFDDQSGILRQVVEKESVETILAMCDRYLSDYIKKNTFLYAFRIPIMRAMVRMYLRTEAHCMQTRDPAKSQSRTVEERSLSAWYPLDFVSHCVLPHTLTRENWEGVFDLMQAIRTAGRASLPEKDRHDKAAVIKAGVQELKKIDPALLSMQASSGIPLLSYAVKNLGFEKPGEEAFDDKDDWMRLWENSTELASLAGPGIAVGNPGLGTDWDDIGTLTGLKRSTESLISPDRMTREVARTQGKIPLRARAIRSDLSHVSFIDDNTGQPLTTLPDNVLIVGLSNSAQANVVIRVAPDKPTIIIGGTVRENLVGKTIEIPAGFIARGSTIDDFEVADPAPGQNDGVIFLYRFNPAELPEGTKRTVYRGATHSTVPLQFVPPKKLSAAGRLASGTLDTVMMTDLNPKVKGTDRKDARYETDPLGHYVLDGTVPKQSVIELLGNEITAAPFTFFDLRGGN